MKLSRQDQVGLIMSNGHLAGERYMVYLTRVGFRSPETLEAHCFNGLDQASLAWDNRRRLPLHRKA